MNIAYRSVALIVVALFGAMAFAVNASTAVSADSSEREAKMSMDALTQFGDRLERELVLVTAINRALVSRTSEAFAQKQALRVYFVQKALIEMGFDVGEADGIMGRRTRDSFGKYAASRAVEASFESVYRDLSTRHDADRVSMQTEEVPIEVMDAVKESLKDPYSAKFSDIYYRITKSGVRIYCGEVNSKNGFGAYVGKMKFYVSESDLQYVYVDVGEPIDQAELLCAFRD